MQDETFGMVDRAIGGDKQALTELLITVQDTVYNLSVRMLGNPHDAEDASQEIYMRIITRLSTFKKESAFSTWAYRIAVRHLLNYKKSMFAKMQPLTFDSFGGDIENGALANASGGMEEIDAGVLGEELKMSCTNVMLQCFDSESRLIYVLGVMFRVDSKICGEILGIEPGAYRQRLSRIRQKMAGFLKEYCGLAGSVKCSCQKRVPYAVSKGRINPLHLEYALLEQAAPDALLAYMGSMEEMDAQSQIFSQLPKYRSPQIAKDFLKGLLESDDMAVIRSSKP